MIENIPWEILLNPLCWLIGLIWLGLACVVLLVAWGIVLFTSMVASNMYQEWKRKQ